MNPGGANTGGFQVFGTNANGLGDACECGDANGSGAAFEEEGDPSKGTPSDLRLVRERRLVGLSADAFVALVCSVSGGPDCDTKDAVILQRAFNSQAPGVAPQCDAVLPD